MPVVRMSANGRIKIPGALREAARLSGGDLLAVEHDDDLVTIRKLPTLGDPCLEGLEATLGEWRGAADEDAWRDL